MSKKIDSFRQGRSREAVCFVTERPDKVDHSGVNNNNVNNNNTNAITKNNNNNSINVQQLSKLHLDEKLNRKLPSNCQRSPSPFKSFFIRMGSTGMLNSTKSNRRSQNLEERLKILDKESLFRSCSTSQLNNSPTYVKGDDPSEGIDLQISARKDKTVSCDNLASGHQDNEQGIFGVSRRDSCPSNSLGSPSVSFSTYDLGRSEDDEPSTCMRKSSSCDLKEARKSSFPYAFLRSKLSVLPEERHGSLVSKDERLFKTASEEHFPTLKIEDSYNGTTTLGRRRLRIGNGIGHGNPVREQETASGLSRTSYTEFRRNSSGYEADRYTNRLERLELSSFPQRNTTAGCYSLFDNSLLSLRENTEFQQMTGESVQEKANFAASRVEPGMPDNCGATDLDVITSIRNNRRNSASSSCEQRLSSHYVSSNESGYDSDGPRGEFVVVSENEGSSLKCSSDTSSVIDSEAEKLMRSSTPSEYQDVRDPGKMIRRNSDAIDENRSDAMSLMNIEGIDGLKWHRSGSGRMLPSIHGTSFDEDLTVARLENHWLPNCDDKMNFLSGASKILDVSPHRMRLQQDKTRFLSDIIQPFTRVRRCCVIQLHKKDPKESLGIRLAQQRLGEPRYIIVQLESDGIAHR